MTVLNLFGISFNLRSIDSESGIDDPTAPLKFSISGGTGRILSFFEQILSFFMVPLLISFLTS